MAQPILTRSSYSHDQYIHEMQSLLDSGLRLFDPDIAIQKDPAFPAKVRRSPVVVQGLDIRTNKIAGRAWHLEPRSEGEDDVRCAAILEDVIREGLDDFRPARKHLALAVFDSRSYAVITGRRKVYLAGGKEGTRAPWWTPTRLQDLHESRVQSHIEDGVPVWKVWSFDERDWVVPDRRQMIEVVYEDTEERLGYGRGLREAIYFTFLVLTTVEREGLQGLERWAQGLPVAQIDTTRLGNEDQTVEDLKTAFLSTLKKMRAKYGGVVVDKEDVIDVKWPSGEGHRQVFEWINLCESRMTRLLTGSLLPSGGGDDTGSLARAEVEEESSDSVILFDRGVLDGVLTRDLVRLVFDANRENLVTAGLGDARCPRFRTTSEKAESGQESRENLRTARDIGLSVKKQEAYEKLGLTPPGEDDEVLELAPSNPLEGLGFKR